MRKTIIIRDDHELVCRDKDTMLTDDILGVTGENNATILYFITPEKINGIEISEFEMVAVFSGTYGSFKKIVENNTLSLTSDLTQSNYVDVSVQFVKDNEVKWESFKKRFYFADGNDDSGINVIDTAKADQREADRTELAGVVTELTGEDFTAAEWNEILNATAELLIKSEQDIVDLTGYSELTNAFRQATTAPSLITGGYNLDKDENEDDILIKLPYLYTPNAKYNENTPISNSIIECSFDVSASGDTISHTNEESMFNQPNRSKNLSKLKLTGFERIAYGNAVFSNVYGSLSNLVELTLEEGNNYRDEYSAGYYQTFFRNCRKLEAVLGTPLDMSRGTTYSGMFQNCESLRYVRFKPGTICRDLDLSYCPALIKKYEATTDDQGTLLSIINGVRDYTGAEDPITIKFSTFVKSYLSSWRCTIDEQTGLYVYSDRNSDNTMWTILTTVKGVVIS